MGRICGAVKVDQRVEITDEESARAWLRTQDHQTQVWFAARCALRALPAFATARGASTSRTILISLRSILAAAAASSCPTLDIRARHAFASAAAILTQSDLSRYSGSRTPSAIEFASWTARSAAQSVSAFDAILDHAVSTTVSLRQVAQLAYSEYDYERDGPIEVPTNAPVYLAATRDANAPLRWQALWPEISSFARYNAASKNLRAHWRADDADWSFWIEWYEGILNGTPMDWDLIFDIATKVTEQEWEAGQAVVAERIKEIQSEFLAARAPLAERLEINPDTGLFRAIPLPIENAALITTLVSRVQDALEDALHSNNGLNAMSNETRILNRTFARYANDPQRVEMDFTSVAVGLRRQIHETHELPDNAAMLALLEATEEGVHGLRATHPEVAANRTTLSRQALNELSGADKEVLERAQPILVEMSEGEVAEDFAADIPALINDALLPLPAGAPKLPGADPATRIFNRVSKMHMLIKDAQSKAAAAHDSNTNKSVQLLVQYGGYAYVLHEIVKIGLRSLGEL